MSYQIPCFSDEIGRFVVVIDGIVIVESAIDCIVVVESAKDGIFVVESPIDGIVVVETAMTTKESSLKWR